MGKIMDNDATINIVPKNADITSFGALLSVSDTICVPPSVMGHRILANLISNGMGSTLSKESVVMNERWKTPLFPSSLNFLFGCFAGVIIENGCIGFVSRKSGSDFFDEKHQSFFGIQITYF